MRRGIRIAVLALGTVLGYGFAIHSMRHHRHHREAFERHVAEVCVGAANSLRNERAAPRPGEPAAP
jgi:hypothetical protein